MWFERGFLAIFFLLLTVFAVSTFTTADDILESRGSTARILLQVKTACPVNFEFLNYTVITSQCKAPKYPATLCCKAFKEFACPYADLLNNVTNDCASTMFSYINLYGKYPPGLFASKCRSANGGLACPAPAPAPSPKSK
ncbi:hypothetical protein MRB53_028823 [Persea americana]|uniref:Uncharacterized protein n=1 Tax=Persea americana TaxID=3435 RepID=A0ACC2KH70_PERAE|nr:hypothetical protein MRB53_028823 [Persea americana]